MIRIMRHLLFFLVIFSLKKQAEADLNSYEQDLYDPEPDYLLDPDLTEPGSYTAPLPDYDLENIIKNLLEDALVTKIGTDMQRNGAINKMRTDTQINGIPLPSARSSAAVHAAIREAAKIVDQVNFEELADIASSVTDNKFLKAALKIAAKVVGEINWEGIANRLISKFGK
ncbi:unnamed protein product [Meganyctiphanes norvegica]|uniref:Uncharacterized protein n=1 Tax=Meganyctiphanes norvegica TaxID=48144 RepID=A0AAV2RER0_MEGNR